MNNGNMSWTSAFRTGSKGNLLAINLFLHLIVSKLYESVIHSPFMLLAKHFSKPNTVAHWNLLCCQGIHVGGSCTTFSSYVKISTPRVLILRNINFAESLQEGAQMVGILWVRKWVTENIEIFLMETKHRYTLQSFQGEKCSYRLFSDLWRRKIL
jgi:hypothetical protein